VAEESAQVRTGSCICRGVTFRVTGEPLRVGICHCTDCRKTSGSVFAAFAIWPRDAFGQVSGTTGTYAGRSFCSTCGGRVTSISDDEAEIMIGALDKVPTDLTPQYELWIGRRESWLTPLQSATQLQQDAEVSKAEVQPPAQPDLEVSTPRKPPG
jgi:hypothetical protein